MIKNKLLKNISWLFFDKIVRIFGGLFIGIWIARYLGPEDFGVLNYALAYTALFMLFVNLGLDQIVVREIVKTPKLLKYLLGTTFWLKFIGALLSILFISISLYFMKLDTITTLVILVTSIGFIFQSFDVIDYYFQSQVLSKYVAAARSSAFILSSTLKIFLIINEFSVLYFAVALVIDALFATIFLIYIYQKRGMNILKWKFSKNIAVKLLKYSWPLALSGFIISVYTKIDQIMIGNMLNLSEVGIYGVATTLSTAWLFLPSIVVSTFMPYFVNLKKTNNELYEYRLIQLYSLMFWIGVSVGVIVLVFGQWIIHALYGPAYEEAYYALVFNIWNGIFISQALARSIWLISENLQKYRLYNNIFAVTLNIGVNFVLIPIYGISGAAIATLLTQGLSTWVFPFLWKPMRSSNIAIMKAINPKYFININIKENNESVSTN